MTDLYGGLLYGLWQASHRLQEAAAGRCAIVDLCRCVGRNANLIHGGVRAGGKGVVASDGDAGELTGCTDELVERLGGTVEAQHHDMLQSPRLRQPWSINLLNSLIN
jgi:hypothetical protein